MGGFTILVLALLVLVLSSCSPDISGPGVPLMTSADGSGEPPTAAASFELCAEWSGTASPVGPVGFDVEGIGISIAVGSCMTIPQGFPTTVTTLPASGSEFVDASLTPRFGGAAEVVRDNPTTIDPATQSVLTVRVGNVAAVVEPPTPSEPGQLTVTGTRYLTAMNGFCLVQLQAQVVSGGPVQVEHTSRYTQRYGQVMSRPTYTMGWAGVSTLLPRGRYPLVDMVPVTGPSNITYSIQSPGGSSRSVYVVTCL